MNLKVKVLVSVCVFSILILAYYLLVVTSHKYLSEFCNNFYCLEIISLGEYISILIALIGLYFVISSLNDWKQQDKYNNAKNRVDKINRLEIKITMEFGHKICSLYITKKGEEESKIIKDGTEADYVRSRFIAYIKDSKILSDIRELDRENFNSKNCLFQEDFDYVISQAYKYISGCHKEIITLKMTEDDSRKSYEGFLSQVYRRHRLYEHNFTTALTELNKKISNIVNQ